MKTLLLIALIGLIGTADLWATPENWQSVSETFVGESE